MSSTKEWYEVLTGKEFFLLEHCLNIEGWLDKEVESLDDFKKRYPKRIYPSVEFLPILSEKYKFVNKILTELYNKENDDIKAVIREVLDTLYIIYNKLRKNGIDLDGDLILQ